MKFKVYKQLLNSKDEKQLLQNQEEDIIAIGRSNEDGLGPVSWWN